MRVVKTRKHKPTLGMHELRLDKHEQDINTLYAMNLNRGQQMRELTIELGRTVSLVVEQRNDINRLTDIVERLVERCT